MVGGVESTSEMDSFFISHEASNRNNVVNIKRPPGRCDCANKREKATWGVYYVAGAFFAFLFE